MSRTLQVALSLGLGLVLIGTISRMPRGLRINNPLNIKHGNDWEGETPGNDQTFETFAHNALGIRAGAIILINYYQKHGLDTLTRIIQRFAPKSENATDQYIKYVSEQVGIGATQRLAFEEFLVLLPGIIRAMVNMEQGSMYSNALVSDADIDMGIRLAMSAKGLASA